jgi:hypothetical protein
LFLRSWSASIFWQQWYSLSDLAVEDALHESPVLRRFVGIDLGGASAINSRGRSPRICSAFVNERSSTNSAETTHLRAGSPCQQLLQGLRNTPQKTSTRIPSSAIGPPYMHLAVFRQPTKSYK